MVGQTLSHYKILDKLGAGGMGEVYLAEDTTLKRQVALKVLPPELAASQDRLERFQREAETLAALDHPNIVHIYSVEEADGVRFLTMQLVEGKRLSDLIPKSGMPLERIFKFAIPLADALAAAHEKGVIHRDLKPGNIMVTNDGRVKVLDFGLAKLRPELDPGEATALPTEPLTDEGRILGTVPYMSPEQLEGRELDARTDVFSLGIVLYEMATGERPFRGDSSVSIISSIIRDTPREIDTLRPELPHHLARIIRHSLEKEPQRRYHSALDVRNELEDLKTESASGEVSRMSSPRSRLSRLKLWMTLSAAGLVLAAGLATIYWALRPGGEQEEVPTEPLTGRFSKLTFDPALEQEPSLSPDGRFFVYASDASGNWDIYLQRIGGGNAINLTEDSLEDDRQPAFSPDGESIAFRSERDDGGIYVMGATGESVRRITEDGFRPDWSPDGAKIVFSTLGARGRLTGNPEARIWTVELSTGDRSMVLDHSALMPAWSPNGRRVAYYGYWEPAEGESRYDLFTVSADGGEPLPVTDDEHFEEGPAWSADGEHLFFVSGRGGSSDLWRVPIDERTGQVLGDPEPVTSGANVGLFSLAQDGTRILYRSTANTWDLLRVPFDPVAERVVGLPVSITPPGLQALRPSVSPDGEWIAFDAEFGQPGSRAIGMVRTDGTGLRQLTDSGHRDLYPKWSPDGRRLIFYGNRSGNQQAWIINADGSGLRQLTEMPETEFHPPIWSPDGSRLATSSLQGEVTYIFDPNKSWSEEPPTQLVGFGDEEGKFLAGPWSPDGRRLAGFCWRKDVKTGGFCLYSFDTGDYEELRRDGWPPKWLNDGRRLMFRGQDESTIFLLDTETGEIREVMSSDSLLIAPDLIGKLPALSPDNRSIYIERQHQEADIWLLAFDQQP
ncbi:MAG: protein kinase [Thermoanaerobaculia bacterium]